MQGLACQNCQQTTIQFTILKCDHVVCAECLWSQVKTTLQGMNSIVCTCGITTIFVGENKIFNESSMKTQPISSCVQQKTLSSQRSASIASSSSRSLTCQRRPKGEFNIELQFLDVQFKKSIEQAEKNFARVIRMIKEKYTNLVQCIDNFWKEERIQNHTFSTLGISSMLNKKYQNMIGENLRKLNECLLEKIVLLRLQANPLNIIKNNLNAQIKPDAFSMNKENDRILNYEQDKARLLKAIQNLKMRNGPMKKLGRNERPLFQKN